MTPAVGQRDYLLANAATRYLVSTVGRSLVLSANSPVFAVSTAGAGLPAQVQITASLLSIDGPVVFSAPAGTTITAAGHVATLKFADMGADQVTISASVYDADSDTTYLASQTISKVYDGKDGQAGAAGRQTALVYAYIRSAAAPAAGPGAVTFDFTIGRITAPTGNALASGYSKTIPAGSDPLYVAVASASSITATDEIAAGEWGAAVKLAENGTAGLNSATVTIYQRSDDVTPPALPTAITTYAFGTGVLAGLTGGWSQAHPAGAGRYVHVSTATASSTGVTDTIAASEWAAARVLTQNGQRGTVTISAGGHPTWSDSAAAGEIANAGYGAPINRDVVTLYDGSRVVTKFFQGGQWYAMAMKVDGNLLVTGSVAADALNVVMLSAITANLGNITAGDLYGTTLHGGAGYPTNAYSWPGPDDGGGFHLSERGLLLGNRNAGAFVELRSDGHVAMPGLTVTPAGQASYSGQLSAAGGSFTGNVLTGVAPGFRVEMGPDDPVYAMWAGSGAKTDANAIFFLKRSGAGYFGGALTGGVLRTSVTNPTVDPASQVIDGPFGSNGGTITVVGSIDWASQRSSVNHFFTAGAGTTQAVLRLYRKIGTGSESLVHTATVPGNLAISNIEPADEISSATWTTAGSFTYTDPVTSNVDRTYRLEVAITSQAATTALKPGATGTTFRPATASQRLTIITTE